MFRFRIQVWVVQIGLGFRFAQFRSGNGRERKKASQGTMWEYQKQDAFSVSQQTRAGIKDPESEHVMDSKRQTAKNVCMDVLGTSLCAPIWAFDYIKPCNKSLLKSEIWCFCLFYLCLVRLKACSEL